MSTIDNNIKIDQVDQDTIRFFIWSVWNFFNVTTEIPPKIGTPYLFNNFEHSDYTGIIGVSGNQKGAVHVTMPKDMVNKILSIRHSFIFDGRRTEEAIEILRADCLGEAANIISGNVRNYLGEQFLISVPVVVTAKGTPMRTYKGIEGIVFPVKWNDLSCDIVLCLKKGSSSNVPSSAEFEEVEAIS